MWPYFRYTSLLIWRSRITLVLALLGVGLVAIAWLAANFSPRQPETVMLDVGLSFIRLILPLVGILLVQEFIGKEIERRTVLSALTYPRARSAYLLGRFAGIAAAMLVLLAALGAILALWTWWLGREYAQSTPVSLGLPYLITLGLIWLDGLVIISFATLLSAIATTGNLVLMGSLGFLLITRSLGAVLQILSQDANVVAGAKWYESGLQTVLFAIPDLGLLDVRRIALYGKMDLVQEPWLALLTLPLAYAALLLFIAAWRFQRRQFA